MEIATRTRHGARSVVLPSPSADDVPTRMTPGRPEVMVGPEPSWGGVSVCEMDMRWPDGHACHEITCEQAALWLVVEQVGGEYEHRIDPREPVQTVRRSPRVMSLVPPGVEVWGYAHSIRLVRCLRLTFDLERAGLALGDRRLEPAFAAPRLMFASQTLWQIAWLLASEYRKQGAIDGLYAESIATALCVELLRLDDGGSRPVARGGLAPWQMRRITEYLEAHLADTIPVRDFAQLVGMSRSHFNLAFRTTTGIPPYRWQLNARIHRAQELLLERALPLVEIALQTGFADQSHFTKSFRRCVGTSPAAWRRGSLFD
jgi:AraC family transcriptional regulator